MYKQTLELELAIKNNVLYENQFGFQASQFADHAILDLVNSISNSFKNGEFTLVIFVNLQEAFETVDHTILLNKLNQCCL